MVNCTLCKYYIKEVNICSLFNMQLQRLAQVDECTMDPSKIIIEEE